MKRWGFMLFLLVIIMAVQAQATKDDKEAKKLEKLKRKHENWIDGWLIKKDGDTIRVKIKPTGQLYYNTTVAAFQLYDEGLRVAYTDHTEETFQESDFLEMFTANNGAHYVVITTNQQQKYITRVAIEGKCKLLFREVEETSIEAKTLRGNGTYSGPAKTITTELGIYYCLYKGVLTKIPSEKNAFQMAESFRKKCNEIFGDCPQLVAQIENKTNSSMDLRIIVWEFNNCLNSK